MVYNSERHFKMQANGNWVMTVALFAACFLFVLAIGTQADAWAEAERSIVGVWVTGEDIDITYSFCVDGTFTYWNTYYYFKNGKQINVSRERIGCGTYTTGKDEISNTIDLHFQHETECVALGRYAWSTEPYGELALNIAECGEARPDSPNYYVMRVGGIYECTCAGLDACETADIQMASLSGRYGYGLTGAYDFAGSLTKNALTDAEWHLVSEFRFPTAGYSVGTPLVSIQESYPEQVSVTFTITRPAPGAVVAQVITPVPVSLEIPASNQAKFTLRTQACYGGVSNEGEGENLEGEGEPVEGELIEGEPVEGETMSEGEQAEFLLEQFDSADGDGDGMLSMTEVLAVLPDWEQEQFDRLDTDGNGLLSREELESATGFAGFCDGFSLLTSLKQYIGDLMLFGMSLSALLILMGRQK